MSQTMQKKVVPMFHVPDVRRTVDWYRDIGFDVTVTYDDHSGGLSFAMVSFGAGEVMFSSGGRLSSHPRREVDLYAYTADVDNLYDQIKGRVEIVEGPHNMFYGMREIIVRDLNGFWITFGQQIPPELLTPWPAVDAELLQPYAGRYESDNGSGVLIKIDEGRLMAFPDDAPGVFLMPVGEHTFTPMMTEQARVVFEGGAGADDGSSVRAGGQDDAIRPRALTADMALAPPSRARWRRRPPRRRQACGAVAASGRRRAGSSLGANRQNGSNQPVATLRNRLEQARDLGLYSRQQPCHPCLRPNIRQNLAARSARGPGHDHSRSAALPGPRRKSAQAAVHHLSRQEALLVGAADTRRPSRGSALPFEELHGSLVLLGSGSSRKRAEVSPATGSWIDLSRVQAILARLQLANHGEPLSAPLRREGCVPEAFESRRARWGHCGPSTMTSGGFMPAASARDTAPRKLRDAWSNRRAAV